MLNPPLESSRKRFSSGCWSTMTPIMPMKRSSTMMGELTRVTVWLSLQQHLVGLQAAGFIAHHGVAVPQQRADADRDQYAENEIKNRYALRHSYIQGR